ncbi:putative bifunctional diguanylate cyclase/phosphodiesterase [Oceanospirillum sanctuarii]|uniref:putative bifunctional diguanylate cyclase/phosphodiesterase n=1 Tax=Oceanospirillum sanctuarii TaxID=1434821 RepID=UPI000A3D4253|nr:GGDEF domain-containing phosphodiesterase [Oceanospirillum sanctuarii]
MINLSLRTRYILLLAFSSIVMMVFFAVVAFSELQRLHQSMSEVGQSRVNNALTEDLIERSEKLLDSFAPSLAKAIQKRDQAYLKEQTTLFSRLPMVRQILIYDIRQSVLLDSDTMSSSPRTNVQSRLPFSISLDAKGHRVRDDLLVINHPLSDNSAKVGGITLILSLDPIKVSVSETHKAIDATLTETRRHFLQSLLFLLLIFGGLILLLSALFSYSISSPINTLMAYSEKLALGLWELPSRLRKDDEFGRLGHAFRQMAMQIQANVRSTENLAFYDQLTGIGNRTFFQQQITDLLDDSHEPDFVVIQIGLDNFKWFNETRGYNAGDELLRQVVSGCLLAVNEWCNQWAFSRERIGIYRLGGDEFGIVADGEISRHSLNALTTALMNVFDNDALKPRRLNGIQASIGVVRRPEPPTSLAEVQTQAAIALNVAKKQGKNRVVYFEAEMNDTLKRRYQIEEALLTARSGQQLYMVYQPQVSLEDGRIIGYEALMRWQHPELGFISPGEFFPIAEQMPVIRDLGEFVIQQVMEDIPQLTACHDETLKVSLNVSAAQFYYHDVAGMIIQSMREHQISPQQIAVELTETSLLEKDQVVVEQLQRMRDAGLSIQLDDFGTGYASLNYLKEFPITGLKLDRSYTARLCSGDHADFALFESLLFLAKNLGLNTVVEGIENEHEERQAKLAGARIAQGFKYAAGKPLSAVLLERQQYQSLKQPEPVLN